MPERDRSPLDNHSFLAGGGAIADLIAAFDWTTTPLGAIETWPQSLKTTVAIMLRSTVPMTILWGWDGIMIYNEGYAEIAASRHPMSLGSRARESWPEVADFNDNVIKVGMAGGTLAYRDQELTLLRRERPEQVWLNLDYSPIIDESGAPVGVIAIVVETTAKVQAELWRKGEQDRLRRMFEQAPGFVAMMTGPEHVFELVNPAYMQLIGHRDVLNKPVRQALPDIAGQGFYELLDQVYATGHAFAGNAMPVHLQRTPDAATEERHVDLVYQPLRNPAGEIVGIFAQGTDVTDRVLAEAAARANENQFRVVAQAMPNHVWTSPPSGVLDWFNDGCYAYAGVRPGEFENNGWTRIVHPDDLAVAVERWTGSLADGRTYETEFRLLRSDGVYRWHIARAVPIIGPSGEITRWIGTNTDIEDQKKAAGALADINTTLEALVEARTGELMLAEDALRQAQKMEAVGQLTGGIAHDFNNLLQGITGSLDLVQKRVSQGRFNELDRFIAGAMTSAKRASALTHRLLAFSRRQPLDPRPVRANPLVSSMEDLLRRTLGERIELELVLAGGLWLTVCDPNQLENAILNLAINARDAMPDGGKLVIETCNAHLDSIYAKQRDIAPGQYVCVCVSDTGTGMSEDTIARAFEPFFTTKPIGQGTGLGLSMIYGFARQSEGYAKIYSELGKGTTVKLYLPRHRGAAEQDEVAPALSGPHAAEADEVVLVVEDEPVVRGLIVEVLSDLGYRAIEAADGPSGLEILQSRRAIDLLITDVGLPGLNGRQVADAGRLLRPGLKVLFMTGYAENAALASGFLEPGMAMVTKPFAMETLATRIRDIIGTA